MKWIKCCSVNHKNEIRTLLRMLPNRYKFIQQFDFKIQLSRFSTLNLNKLLSIRLASAAVCYCGRWTEPQNSIRRKTAQFYQIHSILVTKLLTNYDTNNNYDDELKQHTSQFCRALVHLTRRKVNVVCIPLSFNSRSFLPLIAAG